LGAIYEGLLEYQLHWLPTRLSARPPVPTTRPTISSTTLSSTR
jgi:hypothetical protein